MRDILQPANIAIVFGLIGGMVYVAIVVGAVILFLRVIRALEKIGMSLERIASDYHDRGAATNR
jgi:hypothetical protein